MSNRRSLGITAIALASAVSLAGCAGGTTGGENEGNGSSDFPNKRIELIVPWGAGGGTDQVARQLAMAAERLCGWNISVSNMDGGGGAVGHAAIADANPDGYTVGSIDTSLLFYQPSGVSEISPDAMTPVMQYNVKPTTIAVGESLPYETIDDLVAAAKSGENIRVAVSSLGGAHHIAALGFAQAAGIDLTYVPYPGGNAEATQGILAGEVEALLADDAEILPFAEAGELKPLALMTQERGDVFPEVPTLIESGIDWSMEQWRGLAVPNGTPDEVVSTLEECFLEASNDETFLEFMEVNGFVPVHKTAEEFGELISTQFASAKELSALVE